MRPSTPGSIRATGASSSSRPASTTVITAAAVIGLVIEAIRNGDRTVAAPNACS